MSCSWRRSRTVAAPSSCSKAPKDRARRRRCATSRPRSTRAISPSTNAASTGVKRGRGIGWRDIWAQLPTTGNTSIFFRSWYRRVIDDRVLGRIDETAVPRSFDEINEFEAQQRDYGTLIVKLYFEASAEAQRRRLDQRALNPWRQSHRELPIETSDSAYLRALAELKAHSDTRWSPWKISSPRTTSTPRCLRSKPLPRPGRRRCRPSRHTSLG